MSRHRDLGKTARRRRRRFMPSLERLEIRNLFAGLDDLPLVVGESESKEPVEESVEDSGDGEVKMVAFLADSEEKAADSDEAVSSDEGEVVDKRLLEKTDEGDGEPIMYTLMTMSAVSDEGEVKSDEEVLDESSEEIPIRMLRSAEDGGEGSDADGEVRSEDLGEEVVDPDQIIYMMAGAVDESGEVEVTDRSLDEDSGAPVDDSEIVYFGDEASEEEVMYTLTSTGRYDWYNDSDPLDTNGDGALSPIDVLLVMEALDRSGSTELTNAMRPNTLFREDAPNDQAYYLDGNDDSYVSPIDVLLRVHYFTGDTDEEAMLDSGRLMADPTGQFDDTSDTSLSEVADESLGLVADESGDAFWEGDADLDGTRIAMPVDESESGDEKPDSESLDDFWSTYPADSDEVLDEELVDLIAE